MLVCCLLYDGVVVLSFGLLNWGVWVVVFVSVGFSMIALNFGF